jgi:HNH/ENDO VII superfamily nuclease with conserved GHE residues
MGSLVNKNLENGEQVVLANWDQYEPTQHGAELRDRAWNSANSRTGLAFYESTVQFMRNDWAEKNMSPQHIKGSTDNVALYYSNETNTWHTADALDVDHITPWKKHLQALDVANMAEAHMGYNDVANLRALPSFFNRARDSGEKVLEQHGNESPQWQKWVKDRIGYDHTVDHPAFDPQTDKARRTIATTGQAWTQDNTRSDLSFDTRVKDKWFEHQLQESFAGTANLPCAPKGSTQEVPLFRCSVTGQLVTRDALDIDHRVPFETVLKDLQEKNPNGLTKAQVLDAYNDTGNLRLVGRSANSSHEWELDRDGQFRDKEIPERPGEFKGWLVKGAELEPSMKMEIQDIMQQRGALQRRGVDLYWEHDQRQQQGYAGPTLLSDSKHTDYGHFKKAMEHVDALDPKREHLPEQFQRDNLASSMVVTARKGGLASIDHVFKSHDGHDLILVSGDPKSDSHHRAVQPVTDGVLTSIVENTKTVAQLPSPQQPVQNVHQQHTQQF